MAILPFVALLAAVASVNAGACPAKGGASSYGAGGAAGWGAGGGNSALGQVSDQHGISTYGDSPWAIPAGDGNSGPAVPANPPDCSLSTSGAANHGLNSTSGTNSTNGPTSRGAWLPGFDIDTDTTTTWPNTGNVVKATFTLTNTTYAPDGGEAQTMLLVNGQYPGPLLEGNWGDVFEVTVINNLQDNGTSIHWHGLRQLGNNANDGVGGITECPIPPGGQRVYRFQATAYGSTWYHSHFSVQYGAGVMGPIVIHGPASANYDIDLGSVLLNELYDQTAFQADYFSHRFGPPHASNYLVNGMNVSPDGSRGQRAQFQFTPGKKHLLRFVNVAADTHFKVQLDGHKLLVISNDNTPICPYWTTELSIGIGERYDVVVVADQAVAAYYLRTFPAPGCSFNANAGTGTANAVVYYDGAGSSLPAPTAANVTSPLCNDEPLSYLIPIVPKSVDSTGFAAQFKPLPVNVSVATLAAGERVFLWYINGISQSMDWSAPTISTIANNANIANAGANLPSLLPSESSTISLPTAGVWTFWVIQNQFFVPHPMHLHGHDFAVLGQGQGHFDPDANLADLNFENPTRRDTVMLAGSGWTVIAFETDNPGAWLMHCHIAWHVSEGLSLEFVELPSQMPGVYGSQVGAGSAFAQQCGAWDSYAPTAVYPKSDSGLKRRSGWSQNEHKREAINMDRMKVKMIKRQLAEL